jgi:hypothetical protein
MRERIWWLLVLVLAGCARWAHHSKNLEEFHRDRATCAAKAGQASGANDPYAVVWTSVFDSCMYGEGWRKE